MASGMTRRQSSVERLDGKPRRMRDDKSAHPACGMPRRIQEWGWTNPLHWGWLEARNRVSSAGSACWRSDGCGTLQYAATRDTCCNSRGAGVLHHSPLCSDEALRHRSGTTSPDTCRGLGRGLGPYEKYAVLPGTRAGTLSGDESDDTS